MAVLKRIEPNHVIRRLLDNGRKMMRLLANDAGLKVGDLVWIAERWNTVQFAPDTQLGLDAEERPVYATHAFEADWPEYWGRPALDWLPADLMPISASRLTLRVTNVRSEPLQSISPIEVMLEGLTVQPDGTWQFPHLMPSTSHPDAITAFTSFWDQTHGSGNWDQNPSVTVVSFEVIRGNVEQLLPSNLRIKVA